MMATAGVAIVSDVGGTNARFACLDDQRSLTSKTSCRVAANATFADALSAYCATLSAPYIRSIAVCAAGPVVGGVAQLTNAAWMLSERDIVAQFPGSAVRVINDLEAVGHALPYLDRDDVEQFGGVRGFDTPGGAQIAINVGTGFGAAITVQTVDTMPGHFVLSTEPGHASLALNAELLERAAVRPRSIEDLLSGRGVLQLAERIANRAGERHAQPDGELIFSRESSSFVRTEVSEIVSQALGSVAGDLVLSTGSWGGVYLCGGVVDAWWPFANGPAFRAAFEAKGPMAARLRSVPVVRIRQPDVALAGLARLSFA